MALEVATVDTSLETKFFVSDDLPKTIGYTYSVQTAVVAISLSAQRTEEGQIDLALGKFGGSEPLSVSKSQRHGWLGRSY